MLECKVTFSKNQITIFILLTPAGGGKEIVDVFPPSDPP